MDVLFWIFNRKTSHKLNLCLQLRGTEASVTGWHVRGQDLQVFLKGFTSEELQYYPLPMKVEDVNMRTSVRDYAVGGPRDAILY